MLKSGGKNFHWSLLADRQTERERERERGGETEREVVLERYLWRHLESWTWSSWQSVPPLRNVDPASAPQSLPSTTARTPRSFIHYDIKPAEMTKELNPRTHNVHLNWTHVYFKNTHKSFIHSFTHSLIHSSIHSRESFLLCTGYYSTNDRRTLHTVQNCITEQYKDRGGHNNHMPPNERNCDDCECVWKPIESRFSLIHCTNKSAVVLMSDNWQHVNDIQSESALIINVLITAACTSELEPAGLGFYSACFARF